MGGTIGPHTRCATPDPSAGKTRDGQGLNSMLPRKAAFCAASPDLVAYLLTSYFIQACVLSRLTHV